MSKTKEIETYLELGYKVMIEFDDVIGNMTGFLFNVVVFDGKYKLQKPNERGYRYFKFERVIKKYKRIFISDKIFSFFILYTNIDSGGSKTIFTKYLNKPKYLGSI